MKKLFVIFIALLLILSLAACGKEAGKASSNSETPGTSQAEETPSGNGSSEAEDIGDIDFSKILAGNGATDVIYGELTAAQKQALIDDAKKDGIDVSFGSDGSMTVKDPSDGTEVVQKPDGTWTLLDDQGGNVQLGSSWPDNAFTKMLPTPTLPIVATSTEDDSFAATFSGGTVEDVRAYVEKVQTAGFSVNPQVQDTNASGVMMYMFTGENSAGYTATVSLIGGSFSVMVNKN